jgi:hypothetical protein
MIAKRIVRPKAQSSFERLSSYLLRETKSEEAYRPDTAASRTLSYILGDGDAPGRVGAVRVTNCMCESPSLAIREIVATQEFNKRSRADPTYHLVVSFEPAEHPTSAQLQDIEDELCRAIGLAAHQRISAVHIDKAHLHLHIAINKIRPGSFQAIEPYYDKYKLMAACVALELKHGLRPTNHGRVPNNRPRGKQVDLEAQSGEASFFTYVKTAVEADLTQLLAGRPSWPDVHARLAREGLVLKKRGAGLVITDPAAGLAVKASSINRAFSLGALSAKLGSFERAPSESASNTPYGRAPLSPQKTAPLYADYLRQREEGVAARAAIQAEINRARSDIHRAYAAQRTLVRRSGLTGAGKQKRRREIKLGRDQALGQLAIKRHSRHAELGARFFFTWVAFLQARAQNGDTEALRALRASRAKGAPLTIAALTGSDAAAAKTLILTGLNPEVRRSGELVYRLGDGGIAIDESSKIRIGKASYQATLAALVLAQDRFAGQTLVIEGSDAFRREAVGIAAAFKLNLTFADTGLETERQARLDRSHTPGPSPLDDFIALQNKIAYRLSLPHHYRAWAPTDAGAFYYSGRQTLSDGSQILLLKKDNQIIVKAAGIDEIRKSEHWTSGERLHFDRLNQVATRTRQ